MKPPCDEAIIDSQLAASPCAGHVGPWVLAATILASSMAFIDSTVVNVALPALQANFGANVVDVQWVIEAYGLTLAALILVGGSMGDMFGRRLMFLLGVACSLWLRRPAALPATFVSSFFRARCKAWAQRF